jgi:hypothetical protein
MSYGLTECFNSVEPPLCVMCLISSIDRVIFGGNESQLTLLFPLAIHLMSPSTMCIGTYSSGNVNRG